MNNKNMTFDYLHAELGNLKVFISSGANLDHNQSVVPATLIVKHKNSSMEFLTELYTLYAGKDDSLTDIISDYMIDEKKSKLSVQDMAKRINNEYAKNIDSINKKYDTPLQVNDGIEIKIFNTDSPEDSLYTADVVIKKHKGFPTAFIDTQTTIPECRGKGLMTKVLDEYLPQYCAENQIPTISLEVGAIDGIDIDTLAKIYQSRGFERQSNDVFVKNIACIERNY